MFIIHFFRKHLVSAILLVCAIVGTVYTVKTFYITVPSAKKTKTQADKPIANADNKNPIKRDSHQSKHAQIPPVSSKPQTSINATNSNVVIGPAGDITQTVNNFSEPKPIPLKDRLISCLDEIDKRIIPAFRSGITNFKFKLLPYQLADLQKLSAESGASKYITLTVSPDIIFRKSGTVTLVMFELKPELLQ